MLLQLGCSVSNDSWNVQPWWVEAAKPVSRRGYYLGAVTGVRILRFILSLTGNLDENRLAGTQFDLDDGVVDVDCWRLEQKDLVADLSGKSQVPVRTEYIGIKRWNIVQIANSMPPKAPKSAGKNYKDQHPLDLGT